MIKTGKEWSILFGINFETLDGWFSEKDFNEETLSRWEFLNRASQCKISQSGPISRRDASKYKQKLTQIDGKLKTENTET